MTVPMNDRDAGGGQKWVVHARERARLLCNLTCYHVLWSLSRSIEAFSESSGKFLRVS